MRIIIFLSVLVIPVALATAAYKEGPFPNVTGGFGDKTCHSCHFDNPLNAPGGTLDVSGIPASYTPGQAYPITITLSREGMKRGGFEIAARFTSGRQKAKQAGAWHLLDQRVQRIPSPIDPSLEFVQHTLAGSRSIRPGTNAWTIDWTAPSTGGPVQFNVAGNATNDDDSALGDFIYLRTLRSAPR